MSNSTFYVYERGGYKLDWDTKRDGTGRSPNLTIYWYDQAAGRMRSRSTGTANVDVASAMLDRYYVESRGRECPYCPACGQTIAQAAGYLLLDAAMDYYEEVGKLRVSADSIRARLKHVAAFLALDDRRTTTCADLDDAFAHDFRQWSAAQPVESRNRDGEVTSTRKRSLATTEESLLAVRAALNHAKRKRRIEEVPYFATFGRQSVTPRNTVRLDLATIAKMLDYAAKEPRAEALHRFLVVSVCTLARPDAVYDLSILPERGQWRRGELLLDLNPVGRAQTRKRRPIVGVPRPLLDVLHDTAVAEVSNGWVVHYRGEKVRDVDSSWSSMLAALGLPATRAHRSYVIRRSMATILRNWGERDGKTAISVWDMEGQLGHRERSTSETYACSSTAPTGRLQLALGEVLAEIEGIAPGCFARTFERAAPGG